MKDLGKKILSHPANWSLLKWRVSPSIGIYKESIKHFYMDKLHPLNSPVVVYSLDVNNDLFYPKQENENLLGPKVSYLNAIGALMYLANCVRSNITFAISLLTRYSFTPTRRYWNEIKYILQYLHGTSDMGLYD